MSIQSNDTGIIQVVLERFEKQRLPRMVEIKQRLDDGNKLNEFELAYLSDAIHDACALLPFIERHPEYESLLSRIFQYYKTITDIALSNEKTHQRTSD